MPEKPLIVFRALQVANEHRNAYGLRYNDYQRYRKHCANRTHRLRSSLKMTHGKGRNFQKLPTLTTDNIKEGHLQLLLFETERAWAYAQELYTSSLHPSNDDNAGTLRHSATGRFRRAVNWSTQLLSHCQALYAQNSLSAENLIQATIYTVIVNGRFLRYRDEFEDALVQLSVARGLLDELAATATTSRDQALAVLFSDEIGPEIRHCAHELGQAKAYDIDGIVAQLGTNQKNAIVENYEALVAKLKSQGEKAEHGGSKKKLKEIIWEGQPVPVRNPELVDVLLKVQDGEARLAETREQVASGSKHGAARSKKGIAAYDATLLALSDAEEVARKLAEAQQLTSAAGTSATGGRDIHFVYAYIVYQLLRYRIQRDLLLISALLDSQPESNSATKPVAGRSEAVDSRLYPAVVKLLDTILQSLNQMRTLSVVDDNPDLASAVDARVSFTKARRCVYLARCYVPVKKYAEALTLVQHANIHIRETTSSLSLTNAESITDTHPKFFPIGTNDIKEVEAVIATDSTQFKRDWFAYNGGSVSRDPKGYKKPVFFDIALNYVELDMDKLLERAGKTPAEPAPAPAPAVTAPKSRPAQPQAAKADAAAAQEKKSAQKAKVEEARQETPQPSAQSKSGLTSLLGGWWGRS